MLSETNIQKSKYANMAMGTKRGPSRDLDFPNSETCPQQPLLPLHNRRHSIIREFIYTLLNLHF